MRTETTVSPGWIARLLDLGSASNVCHKMRRYLNIQVLTPFLMQSSDVAIARAAVRFSTCWTFSLHDEHLSVHWLLLAVLAHHMHGLL